MTGFLTAARSLAADCGYAPDLPDDPDDVPFDALTDYKDALEDMLFALAARVDDLEANLREQVRLAEHALALVTDVPVKGLSATELLGVSRHASELRGALDAWRIAVGYFDSPATSRASADAAALDRLNLIFPSEQEWDGCSGRLEDVAEILREVRAPVRRSDYEAH